MNYQKKSSLFGYIKTNLRDFNKITAYLSQDRITVKLWFNTDIV